MRQTGKSIARAAAVLLVMLLAHGVHAGAATGINVRYHTVEEVLEYMENSGANMIEDIVFEEEPSVSAPYKAGKLADSTIKGALAMINEIRYIAGLDANVTYSENYGQMAQAAALVNAALRGGCNHFPPQPEGMEDALYQLGYKGSGSANLAYGYGNLNMAIVGGWMADDDNGNIDRVGHRRWILNPAMGMTGFGSAHIGTSMARLDYYAMYAFDESNISAAQYGVAWPAQVMPLHYFDAGYPWSVSMGYAVDPSAVKVTLKSSRREKTWTFSETQADGYFNVENSYYGQPGCIIFRPDGIGRFYNGEVFDVCISGLKEPVEYSVTFFDYDNPVAVESVEFVQKKITIKEGEMIRPEVRILPEKAADMQEITYHSSDESIAEGYSGIYGVSAGIVTVTAECNGWTDTCEVTVVHDFSDSYKVDKAPSCTEEGSKSRHCQVCSATADVMPIPAKGHAWDDGEVTKEATATKKGVMTYTCEICGETKTEEIPAKGPDKNSGQTPSDPGAEKNPGEKEPPAADQTDSTQKIPVSSIKITAVSAKIAKGKKVTLKAAVSPANAANKAVSWSSSNKRYATVNAKGVVTTKAAGAGKTVKITAKAKDGSGKKAVYTIRIMKGAVKKVTLKGSKSVKAGKTLKLKATVTAAGGANKTLAFTSSNKKYATVDKKGKVKTFKAGKGKTVTITAKATDGSGKKASIKIRIK